MWAQKPSEIRGQNRAKISSRDKHSDEIRKKTSGNRGKSSHSETGICGGDLRKWIFGSFHQIMTNSSGKWRGRMGLQFEERSSSWGEKMRKISLREWKKVKKRRFYWLKSTGDTSNYYNFYNTQPKHKTTTDSEPVCSGLFKTVPILKNEPKLQKLFITSLYGKSKNLNSKNTRKQTRLSPKQHTSERDVYIQHLQNFTDMFFRTWAFQEKKK